MTPEHSAMSWENRSVTPASVEQVRRHYLGGSMIEAQPAAIVKIDGVSLAL